jgi:S1-C subfamily serine protease
MLMLLGFLRRTVVKNRIYVFAIVCLVVVMVAINSMGQTAQALDYSFLNHPEWEQVPEDKKRDVIGWYVDNQLKDDPTWTEVPAEKYDAVRNLFIDEAHKLLAQKEEYRKQQATINPQEIAKKAFGSTVLIVMEDAKGTLISLGSGFFIRGGEIASNLHVVEGAARGYVKLVGQKTKYDIEGITAVDQERDLIILKIMDSRSPALTLGNSDAIQVGESVYAVGNPQGLEGTFSQGIVSGIRQVGTDKLLQITAPISPGSSGGPVLDGEGEVIGVSVATFKSGQNLNFAIPSSYLKTLLGRSGPAKPLSQVKTTKAQRSILVDLGGRNIEGVLGGSFTWSNQLYESNGAYSFTLRNQLRETVKNVHCMVVFYDRSGSALETDLLILKEIIPAGLGRRVKGSVDASVKRLTTPPSKDNRYLSSFAPSTKVEFRILDFEIVH